MLKHEVAGRFFAAVVEQARSAGSMSDDHVTVDGTLIDAWASMNSFQRKGSGKPKPPDDPGNPTVKFRGEKRSNETHQSKTDPESELARKGPGQPSRLAYSGHALMENRHGLLVDLQIARGNESERAAALGLLENDVEGPATVAGDVVATCVALSRAAGRRASHHTSRSTSTARLGDRRANDAARRLPGEPADPEARRGDLWLAQDGGEFPEDPIPRHPERTQHAAHLNGAAYNLLRIAKLTATSA